MGSNTPGTDQDLTRSADLFGARATTPALVVGRLGKSAAVFSPLAVDLELASIHPGAARLFVNLLAAGHEPANGGK